MIHSFTNIIRYFLQFKCAFILILSIYGLDAGAQCPTGSVVLKTQAQVDQFIIDYPNCTEVERLDITLGADIVNVNGLQNLEVVQGDLNITHNPVLTDLTGLNKLKSTGYLWIADNASLVTLNGFPGLTTAYWLFIGDHIKLETVSGFNALTQVNNITITGNTVLKNVTNINSLQQTIGFIAIQNNPLLENVSFSPQLSTIGQQLEIVNNPKINNLTTLDGLNTIGGRLTISENNSLTNLNQLNSVAGINGTLKISGNALLNNISGIQQINPASINGLTIQDNPMLSVCDLPNICTYLQGTGARTISGNAGDCITAQAVIDACSGPECPPGNVTFTTQAQINQFITTYPNCTEIEGNLVIQGADISNLSPLMNIVRVHGLVNIQSNPLLTSLNGLNNLKKVDKGLQINKNSAITNLSGLTSLESIGTNTDGTSLYIRENDALVNISGLNNLSQVNEVYVGFNAVLQNVDGLSGITQIGGNLVVRNNPKLTNINGLLNITKINGYLYVSANAVLADINGLQNIDPTSISTQSYAVTITNNPSLSVCNLPNLCSYLSNPSNTHPRTISGNAADCITEQAVINACNAAACTITIPDPNFKAYLVGNPAINTNGDNEIQCAEAEAFTGSILCPFKSISNLTGIEAFVNITSLDCGGNQLTSLNLNANTKLTEIAVASNSLTSLNVSNCTALQRLYCEGNKLTNLNVSSNLALTILSCHTNQLTSLGLANNIALTELLVHNNKLAGLDLKVNKNLTSINCGINQLISLNLKNGNNTSITSLRAANNPDLSCIEVDNAAYSTSNWVGGEFSFDAQHQFKEDCNIVPDLDGDYCSNAIPINSLFGHPIDEPQASGTYTSEGMNNGNDPAFGHECFNNNLNTIWFSFTGDGNRYAVRSRDCSAKVFTDPNGAMYSGTCDDLTAINCHRDISSSDEDPDANFRIIVQTEVGKTYYLMVEVTSTDDFVTYDKFGDFCLEVTRLDKECIVNIPDANFKAYLLENWEINTNFDNEIQCEEAESFFGGIECSSLGIADLTGIEAFIKINYLDCSDNNLTAIDLSKNTHLEQLNCAGNALSKLDFNSISELWELNCADNQLTALNLAPLYRLQEFDCSNNVLTSLDVSKSSILFTIKCSSNALAYLNLANGNNTLLQAIDARNNPDLTCIQVDNADYSNTNWSTGAFFFDAQHEFNENCEPPCQNAEEIKANYLFASSACVGENVRIIEYGIFTPIADSVSFRWDLGNGQTSAERDPIVSYSNPGTYKVSLRLENIDCPLEITKEIKINNCLKQADDNKISSIFPNPSSGHIQLKADLKKDCDVLVNIYTLDQKLLYSKSFTSVSELRERISLSHKGMVIVEFVYPTGIEKHKVILLD